MNTTVMRHLVCVLLLLFAGSFFTLSIAQSYERRRPVDPDQKSRAIVLKLSGRIPLSPTQLDTLTSIFQDYYITVQANRLQKDKAALKIVNQKRDERVESILQDTGSYKKYLVVLEEENSSKEIEKQDVPRTLSTSTFSN
jgi:hypothetical protein